MRATCHHCKERIRVTDENVRADGASVKCRNCDTVVYFKDPPHKRMIMNEPGRPVSMHIEKDRKKKEYTKNVGAPAKQVLKEEKRERRKHVVIPSEQETGTNHEVTAVKVSLRETTKTDMTSTVESVFDNIATKLEKLSVEDSAVKYNPYVIIIILVGIFTILLLLEFVIPKLF